MSKRELTRTINVTKLTDEQYVIAKGMFDVAIARIQIWIGKALVKAEHDRKMFESREQRAKLDVSTEQGKTLRRQASITGQSPEAIEKAAKVKEAQEEQHKKEQKVLEDSQKWIREHPQESDGIEDESELSGSEVWED